MKRRAALTFAVAMLASMPMRAEAQVTASGHIRMLRVHDVGTKFGPPSDQLDVEVVTILDTQPGKAFGFQLRKDANEAARTGMLDLLRDAYANNWTVSFDHITPPGKNNGRIIRVWLSR
jgi:hypothetical protein